MTTETHQALTDATHSDGVTAARRRFRGGVRDLAMEIILLVLVVFLVFFAPGFASVENLLNVLRAMSMLGIIAFGMTAVVISGEIDLSVGAGAALSGCVTAALTSKLMGTIGAPLAVAIGIAVAVLVGCASGLFTGKIKQWLNVPTFITTLALLTALRGLANMITGGYPIVDLPAWFQFFGAGDVLGVPFPVLVYLIVFVLMHLLMNYTTFGRSIYAVGGNPEAARLSGIDVNLAKTGSLVITGALTAVSGVLTSSQIGSGNGTIALGMELDVIAAVIIGGASLYGGKGTIWGTFVGVLLLGCISNGMTLMNVSEYGQYVVKGAIILGAVMTRQYLDKRT
jgi:ribose/xylose/arabinose/galactoside ABC-type transport system permease subunit